MRIAEYRQNITLKMNTSLGKISFEKANEFVYLETRLPN